MGTVFDDLGRHPRPRLRVCIDETCQIAQGILVCEESAEWLLDAACSYEPAQRGIAEVLCGEIQQVACSFA